MPETRSLAELVEQLQARGVRRVHTYAWRDLDDPEAGGSEVHADEILRRWAAAGLEIVHRTSTYDHARSFERNGYRVEQVGGRSSVLLRTPLRGLFVDRRRADAVVDIWNGLPWMSPWWFRGPRVTWLHHVHGPMWRQYFARPIAEFGRLTEAHVMPRVYRNSTVVTLAESSREELVGLGFRRERIEVIEPGIHPMFVPDAGRRSATPLVVAVGRLAQMKRHIELVRAVGEARRQIPDLRIEIIGEGPDRSALEAGIAALGAGEWCTLRGRVDEATLVETYQRAWVLASASLAEGWGMVITEAAACGTPSVVTRIVGHLDAVREGESGLLVDGLADFAATFVELLSDPTRLAALQQGALAHAAELSWDRAAERHLAALLHTTNPIRGF